MPRVAARRLLSISRTPSPTRPVPRGRKTRHAAEVEKAPERCRFRPLWRSAAGLVRPLVRGGPSAVREPLNRCPHPAVAAPVRTGAPECVRTARRALPAHQAFQHDRVLGGMVVIGGLAACRVEIDLEAGIALDRRGEPPADAVIPRAAVRVPEPDIGRAPEAVPEQRKSVADLTVEREEGGRSGGRRAGMGSLVEGAGRRETRFWPLAIYPRSQRRSQHRSFPCTNRPGRIRTCCPLVP